MAAVKPPVSDGAEQLEPDAFKRLYPQQFYHKFIENGIRPDGRPFGRARPTTIGLRAVETTDASALVKVGSTTVLAGIKLEVLVPTADKAAEGQLIVNVEMTPLASKTARPGRPSEAAACCTEQVQRILKSSGVVDLKKLAIASGRAAWVAYLDMYILDADGSLIDACLLAAVSALASLKALPSMTVNADGKVEAMPSDQSVRDGSAELLQHSCMPFALTCGLYEGKLIVDPTAEEEALMSSSVTVTVDVSGNILGVFKAGGTAEAGIVVLQDCIAAAKLRCQEVCESLETALSSAS